MRRSSTLARIITVIIAIVLAPVGAGLLAGGGRVWMYTVFQYAREVDLAELAGPAALQALGILLLVAVVVTGIWSSAGLIAVGVLALAPVFFAMFPAALIATQRAVRLPLEWTDGIIYGVPLVLFPVLGTMGVVLALVRRRPEPKGPALGLVGGILSPVLLAFGVGLLAWGIGTGMLYAYQRFEMTVQPIAVAAVLGGTILVVIGIAVTRWSPFALLLPALVLLVVNALVLLPDVLFPALFQLPREISSTLPALLLFGTGTATAVLYLSYTFVLRRVRARAQQAPAAPVAPPFGQLQGQHPIYPPSPAQYFPGTGMGPASHSPAIPTYPPAPGTGPTGS
ncbi:hypothetical protein ACIQTT_08160 [Microbacterium sp. NPDC090225]|uniref:hypothetical protein n=1 Tax=Microbacterium sp. NPDC090225 TaxID=3364207 RepID=UPI003826292A